MLNFKTMHLEVFRHKGDSEGRVSLHAQNEDTCDGCGEVWPCSDSKRTDIRGDVRAKHGRARPEGINYLSFYFGESEFIELMVGKRESATDIRHNVRRFGELYTFFDLEFQPGTRGTMKVPYVNVCIPHHVARLLVRLVRATMKRAEPDGARLRIDLPWAARQRWMLHYGQATGKIALEFGSDESRAFFEKCKAEGGETFARCLDNLERIAANQTYKWTETGIVKLSKDWDGFYFRILTPRGNCTHNGGIVNHGRDGAHEWSTHT